MQLKAGWSALLAVAGLLALLSVLTVPQLLYPPLSNSDLEGIVSPEKRVELRQAQLSLQNDARTVLLQGLGGLLLTVGAVATWRQLHISREGQITDRFTHAIDQLGDDKQDVQLGGIYALERIANDSRPDRSTICRILAAFIRTHAPWRPRDQGFPTGDPELRWLRDRAPAVDAALGVLIRRHDPQGQREMHLPLTDLRGAYLVDAKLPGAWLRFTNLAWSIMRGIQLQEGQLQEADLHEADLDGANLQNAKLIGTNLEQANLVRADLRGANLRKPPCGAPIFRVQTFEGPSWMAHSLKESISPVFVRTPRHAGPTGRILLEDIPKESLTARQHSALGDQQVRIDAGPR